MKPRLIIGCVAAVSLTILAIGFGSVQHPLVAPGFTDPSVRPRLILDGNGFSIYQEDHPFHGPWRASIARLDRVLTAEKFVRVDESNWCRGQERVFAFTDAGGSLGPDRTIDGLRYVRPSTPRERMAARLGTMRTNVSP